MALDHHLVHFRQLKVERFKLRLSIGGEQPKGQQGAWRGGEGGGEGISGRSRYQEQ